VPAKVTTAATTATTDMSMTKKTSSSSSSSSFDPNEANSDINYWDPQMAAQFNVFVRRPSHDAWGIPKIVLIYCDDFLQNIYTFPWWLQSSSFQSAIRPILQVLQIPMERIARMLLASLPPGSTIPLHYDTGEWVKYTHRIHVPILVQDYTKIVFRCGIHPQSLQRIPCHVGHVFEINNQTYHTVSNCDSDYRVHLILDYIDEAYLQKPAPPSLPSQLQLQPPQQHGTSTTRGIHDPTALPMISPQRYTLQRGEIIYQTRRSIDRFIHYGQRKTPTFMILGAQKAGTTYLFECIMSHPLAIKPKNNRRETHSLDWNYKAFKTMRQQQQYIQSFYYYKELQYHPSCFTGDSTPSYLMDHVRVIPRIQQLYPHHDMKFIILCRNPIQRAISHYAMVTSSPHTATPAQLKSRGTEWQHKSFIQVVIEDLIHMKQCGLIPYWSIPGLTIHTKIDDTTTIQFILNSLDAAQLNTTKFRTFIGSIAEETAWTKYITTYVPLHTGSYGLLTRGLYHIQIRMWLKAYSISQFLIYKFEAMTTTTTITTTTSDVSRHDPYGTIHPMKLKMIQQIWDHIQVPHYEIPIDILEERKNSRDYITTDIIDPTSKVYSFLQRFYDLHNQQLHTMLMMQLPQPTPQRRPNDAPNESKEPKQASYDTELLEHHWGPSSIQWTA
jgi:hypothetical protein